MPLQETFVAATTPEPPAIYATVGGAISYIAGVTTLAPRWLGGVGLEWAWRLLHSPRRLARRYLVEPVQFAGEAMRQRPLRHSLAGYDGTSPAQNTASADD